MDLLPEFETTDDLGETRQYGGTVGTTPISLPPSPLKPIDAFLIRCPSQSPNTIRLHVSLNGGVNWLTLSVGEYLAWSPRRDSLGNDITQVLISGNTDNVKYEALINFSQ